MICDVGEAETRITLEYTLCMGKPETSSVDKREAWVPLGKRIEAGVLSSNVQCILGAKY